MAFSPKNKEFLLVVLSLLFTVVALTDSVQIYEQHFFFSKYGYDDFRMQFWSLWP